MKKQIEQVIDSREVAEMVGKQHGNVKFGSVDENKEKGIISTFTI